MLFTVPMGFTRYIEDFEGTYFRFQQHPKAILWCALQLKSCCSLRPSDSALTCDYGTRDNPRIKDYAYTIELARERCEQAPKRLPTAMSRACNGFDHSGAVRREQFRFKDIVDLETGETVMELEHEIRSFQHTGEKPFNLRFDDI